MAVESIKITNTETDTDTDTDLPLVLSYKRRKGDDVEEDPKEYPILSPYLKRRRLEEEPDPDDSTQLPEFIKIEKLPDAILFEILYRIPCRWALQCKSVSKRWCSVISHPLFVRNAIHHHRHRHQFSKSNTDPFTLVFYYQKTILALPFDEACGGDGDCDGDGLDFLNFLPCIEFARRNYPFCVEASFNDLLLIRSEVPPIINIGFTEYCICNPFTKQWITLPRLPYQGYRGIVLVGFICNPDSCDKEQEGCITNAHYSYRVVRIHSPTQSNANQLRMQIFSSDTGEWCDSFVSSPPQLNPFQVMSDHAGVVACNGMLHWVDEIDRMVKGFVVFDPFNYAQGCRYIDPPIDLSLEEFVSFGVFQGRLRIFQNSSLQYPYSFSVWELEDYNNAGTWCLKYKIYFKDMVSEYSDLLKIAKEKISTGSLLAFHPNVGEIVFLQFRKYIVLCNMRTGVLTMAGRLQDRGIIIRNSPYFDTIPAKYVFLLGQPSWPTPVPLPLKFDCPSPFLFSEFVSIRQKLKKQEQEAKKLRATPTPIPFAV